MSTQPKNGKRRRALALAACVSLATLTTAWASPIPIQAAATPQAGSLVAGSVTAIAGNVLTIKKDAGDEVKVTVPDSARVVQSAPGAKTLSGATPIKLADISVGDRILAKTTSDGTASTVVAMKQADIAKKQQQDREDWQTHSVSGLVKSADPAAQTVTISTGSGATAKMVIVQASKTTTIRRYAPDSTKFDDAKPATLDQVKPGDQLRAKGEKNADGTQIVADAIVAGTFRNIAGTVISIDPAAGTVTVNDLATKKPFVVDINAESQLHKLSPMMAQGMAMRLKGGFGAPGGSVAPGQGSASGGSPAHGAGAGNGQPPSGSSGSSGPGAGEPPQAASGGAPGQRGGDMQQMLNRAPALQLADLKKGDAIMALTTEGKTPGTATAITLLAGVEPLLQASPNASQSVLSASWNLGGGAAAAGGQDAQ